jgi:GMP synthase (glutamine-hydrolysing)
MILFIKHVDIEGPETLGEFFSREKFPTRTIDLSAGDRLPENFIGLDAVVCLGGPMNVYEEEKFPFLKQENFFIQGLLEKDIPFLGICLGAQLLAKACGGQVVRAPAGEVGFFNVQLTPEGKNDPLFAGVNDVLEVFQWHEDTFGIPAGAQGLADGDTCPHEAFRAGSCAYGLQFHVEITDKNIAEWSDAYLTSDPQKDQKKQEMLEAYGRRKEIFQVQAEKVYNNFFKIIQAP